MPETEWDEVLRAATRLQELLPDSESTRPASDQPGKRQSPADLRDRFDAVLSVLESDPGWKTARVKRPVLILGSLDGVETGIRQLIRSRPLETESVPTRAGTVMVPTLAEMLRVKAWLILRRNAVRDYLDVVALAEKMGTGPAVAILGSIDDYYTDQLGPGGKRVVTQLVKQLAEPRPYDISQVELAHYRRLVPRLTDWDSVARACRDLAQAMIGEGE